MGIQKDQGQQLQVSKQLLLIKKKIISLKKIYLFSVGRQILTKRVGADDDVADADVEDITGLYKNSEGISRHQNRDDGCFSSSFSNNFYFIPLFFPVYFFIG